MDGEAHGVELPSLATLGDLAREQGGALDEGIEGRVVARLVSPEHAVREDDLVVVTSSRWTRAASGAPGVLLCQEDIAGRCPTGRRWVHPHAMFVVARLLAAIQERPPRGVDPLACVDPSAAVHPTASVRARAVILAGASVGPHTVVRE